MAKAKKTTSRRKGEGNGHDPTSIPFPAPESRHVSLYSAAEFNADHEPYPVEIAPGKVFLVRPADILTLVFGNVLPMYLINAAQRLADMGSQGAERVLADLTDLDREQMLDALRRFACEVVEQPKVVLENRGRTDEVWVGRLTFDQLFLIANSLPPSSNARVRLIVEGAQREPDTFRPPSAAVDDAAAPGGTGVRAEALELDPPPAGP